MGQTDIPFTVVGLGEVLWDMLPAGKQLGGAPANFAFHAGRLGADAAPVSCIGNDPAGEQILVLLAAKGLSTRYVYVDRGRPTGRVDVHLDVSGVPNYVIHEPVAWDFIPTTNDLLALAARTDAVCFGTLAQRGEVSRQTIRRFLDATRADCLRIFDINLRQSFYSAEVIRDSLSRGTILKLNDEELPTILRLLDLPPEADATQSCRTLLERYRLRLVALTLGPRGSLLVTTDAISRRNAEPVKVIDTVGAGDAFAAAAALGMLHGLPLDEIHRRASHLAAFVCTQHGAMPAHPLAPSPGHL
jgi:fructokinase